MTLEELNNAVWSAALLAQGRVIKLSDETTLAVCKALMLVHSERNSLNRLNVELGAQADRHRAEMWKQSERLQRALDHDHSKALSIANQLVLPVSVFIPKHAATCKDSDCDRRCMLKPGDVIDFVSFTSSPLQAIQLCTCGEPLPHAAPCAKSTDPEALEQAVVCSHCNDTHRVTFHETGREVMCTHCPTPCGDCRIGGGGLPGAYCATTPCACECHKRAGS